MVEFVRNRAAAGFLELVNSYDRPGKLALLAASGVNGVFLTYPVAQGTPRPLPDNCHRGCDV